MKPFFNLPVTIGLTMLILSCNTNSKVDSPVAKGPHIAFVMGDEEYRSEESMPMLARILKREMNARISLCYSIDSLGFIDPNRSDYINNLAVLDSADLMVLFTRFRALPDDQLKHIVDFAESGKPMVGYRTSTHAFLYKNDSTKIHMNNEWPTKVFGQQWITHHGHFDDGDKPLTHVSKIENKEHVILNGLDSFNAYSWLYHVDGGEWELHGDADPILEGLSLRSNHEEGNRLDKFPLKNPVAWTKSYTGQLGARSRVFFTTLGHPYDFRIEKMRKLTLNGIYWALGLENKIPDEGINAKIEGQYKPNNSGFGEKYKKGMKPIEI